MNLKVIILLIIKVVGSNCDRKVWIGSTEIYDPKNWIGGKIQEDCNGLVFAKYNEVPSFVNNLKVSQLVLPKSGTVMFEEGSSIVFDEKSQDELNCVKLRAFQFTFWFNFSMWKNLDNLDNPAVPYSEIPPCKYDDVVIPKGFNSSITFVEKEVPVKSLTFGKKKLTQDDVDALFSSSLGSEVFKKFIVWSAINRVFKITGEECNDPTGCDRRIVKEEPDPDTKRILNLKAEEIQCYDGIVPYGNFMEPICGAQIVIKKIKSGFAIDKINKKLKDYVSYTHASKHAPENRLQIIFTEKKFTGMSLVEATEFYNLLSEDESYFCEDIELRISGQPLLGSNAYTRNVLSLVFGSLLGVIIMFSLLFFVYSPRVGNLNIRNRLLGTRPLSTYILRYDNIEDRGYIIDGESVAGSVMNLNRSFENPLYDYAPSTRSTSNETVASPKLEENTEDTNKQTHVEKNIDAESTQKLEDVGPQKMVEDEKDDVLLKDL